MYSGRRLGATEALELGVVNRVAAADSLGDETTPGRAEVLRATPAAASAIKRCVASAASRAAAAQGFRLEQEIVEQLAFDPDTVERLTDFVQRKGGASPSRPRRQRQLDRKELRMAVTIDMSGKTAIITGRRPGNRLRDRHALRRGGRHGDARRHQRRQAVEQAAAKLSRHEGLRGRRDHRRHPRPRAGDRGGQGDDRALREDRRARQQRRSLDGEVLQQA